jgi:hypothetical protein
MLGTRSSPTWTRTTVCEVATTRHRDRVGGFDITTAPAKGIRLLSYEKRQLDVEARALSEKVDPISV